MQLPCPLEQLVEDKPRPRLALVLDELVEGLEPVRGLVWIDVGQLVLEFVEVDGWDPRAALFNGKCTEDELAEPWDELAEPCGYSVASSSRSVRASASVTSWAAPLWVRSW
jgi:hypothetical protein